MNRRSYYFGHARAAMRAEQFAALNAASDAAKSGDYAAALNLYRSVTMAEFAAECARALKWLESRVTVAA